MRVLRFGLLLLCLLGLLGACGDQMQAISKMSKIAMNPDIPVGDNSDQPTIVHLHIRATKDANPNTSGKPSPVRLQIFQLKSPHMFMNTDYFSLSEDPKKVLETTYLAHEEYEISPDGWLPMKEVELKPKTEAIGVIAFFNDIDVTQWRAAIPTESKGETYDYLVIVNSKEVRILDKDSSKVKDSKAIRDAEKEQQRKSDHHYKEPQPFDDTQITPIPRPEEVSEPKSTKSQASFNKFFNKLAKKGGTNG